VWHASELGAPSRIQFLRDYVMHALVGYAIDDDEYDLDDDDVLEEDDVLTDTEEPDAGADDDSEAEEIEDGDEPPDLVEALETEVYEWDTDEEFEEEEEF
jgi:hypothetical protein